MALKPFWSCPLPSTIRRWMSTTHRLAELGMDDMRHLGQSLIDAVRAEWPQVQCEGRVGRSVTRTELMNSRGCRVSYTKATMSVYLEAVLIQGTDMLYVSESETSCHPIADVKPLADSMLLQLERASRIAPVPNRAMPVLFTPRGLAGVLIGPLVSGFSGKTVLKGTSPLVGRLGEHIVDERISLWDDPTQPFIPGSRICDDEGIPSRATPLIDRGKAASFLYDLQTARSGRRRRFYGQRVPLPGNPTPTGPRRATLLSGRHVLRGHCVRIGGGPGGREIAWGGTGKYPWRRL